MEYAAYNPNEAEDIVELFRDTFSKSEGEVEGAIIGSLVRELISSGEADIHGFVARARGKVVASIFFSRMWFEQEVNAFILAPVATRTDYQRQGIGQKLINYGLIALRHDGVEIVLTYGDPGFYSKVGFCVVTEEQIPPPFKLSQPEGWMAQSLIGDQIDPIEGTSRCVVALSKPQYW
jgi:putative acetyltransferase